MVLVAVWLWWLCGCRGCVVVMVKSCDGGWK